MGFLLVVLALVAVVAVPKLLKQRRFAALERSAEAHLAPALAGGDLPVVNVAAALKRGESGHYEDAAELYEPRAVKTFSGTSASVRIAKGLSVRSGTGRASSSQEWKHLDTGRLVVTDKRLIFVGNTEHRSFDLGKLDAATILSDGVRLGFSNRQKPLAFTAPNPLLLAGVLAVLQQRRET